MAERKQHISKYYQLVLKNHWRAALVSSGAIQTPPTGHLQQQKCHLSGSWRLESEIRVGAGLVPPGASLLGL